MFKNPNQRMAFFQKLRNGAQQPDPLKPENNSMLKTPPVVMPAANNMSEGNKPQMKFGRLSKKLRY